MQHPGYNELIEFSSSGELATEIKQARAEFVSRTGDLFESDDDFEARIASFLEWYTLDRKVTSVVNLTPAKLFAQHRRPNLTTPELQELHDFARTTLSIFEIKKIKDRSLRLVDILTGTKWNIDTAHPLVGLEASDLIEGRLFNFRGATLLSDIVHTHPHNAKKEILKAAKEFRKEGQGYTRVDMVHRIAFLRNRSVRYSHLDAREIFTELSV